MKIQIKESPIKRDEKQTENDEHQQTVIYYVFHLPFGSIYMAIIALTWTPVV